MKYSILCTLAALSVAFASAPSRADGPVVVELFTSQGCSSCPPADAKLGELAARDDVVALSFHVDYWDYIGWKDIFADPAYTARQRDYARMMGRSNVYTPQMVVNGRSHVVGSRAAQVDRALAEAAAAPGNGITVEVTGTAASGLSVAISGANEAEATVWLVQHGDSDPVMIERGENAGRTVTYHNVVRDMRALGDWPGGDTTLAVPAAALEPAAAGCAILVQDRRTGAILAAARMALPRG